MLPLSSISSIFICKNVQCHCWIRLNLARARSIDRPVDQTIIMQSETMFLVMVLICCWSCISFSATQSRHRSLSFSNFPSSWQKIHCSFLATLQWMWTFASSDMTSKGNTYLVIVNMCEMSERQKFTLIAFDWELLNKLFCKNI